MNNRRKRVFISYSWDNQEHQEWVLNLAKDLITKYGIDVILDQFELSAGKDLTYFMESSIEKADKVLVILTPNYKLKAEQRKSGVGYETSMITKEIFELPISKVKFIPILRKGKSSESTPKFLKSKLDHLMNDDNSYINKLYELSRIIYEKPLVERPELSKIPDFSKKDIDPIIDIANSVANEEKVNNEINQILDSTKGVELFTKEIKKLNARVKGKAELYRKNTPISFSFESDNRELTIIQALGHSVSFYWRITNSNSTKNSILTVRFWKGIIKSDSFAVYFPGEEPKRVNERKYSLDMNYNKEIIWRLNKNKFKTEEIIQSVFLYIIEEIKKEKSEKFRN